MDDIEASLLGLSLVWTAEGWAVASEAAVARVRNVGGRSGAIARLEDATEEPMPTPGQSADGGIEYGPVDMDGSEIHRIGLAVATNENEAETRNGQPRRVTTINQMPELVLLKIFSFFDIYERKWIELVSKRWLQMSRLSLKSVRDVIIDLSRFETRIPFQYGFDDVSFVRLVNGIRERYNLKTLTLMNSCPSHDINSHPDSVGSHRLKRGRNRQSYTDTKDKFGDCFTLVGTSFPNLESLVVSMPRCWLPFRRSLLFCSERFQSLRHLKLNFPVSKVDIREDATSAPTLSLKLKSFPFLVTFDVWIPQTRAFFSWKEYLRRYSNAHRPPNWLDFREPQNTIDISCDGAAPSLKKFRFAPADLLPFDGIKVLVDSCPELEDFELGAFDFENRQDIVELRRLKLKRLSLDLSTNSHGLVSGPLPNLFRSIFYSQSRLELFHLSLKHLQDDDKKEIQMIAQCECENLRNVQIVGF